MKSTVVLTALAAVLTSACASSLERYGSFDASDRTITVPTGSAGLTGTLKAKLREAGWKMEVYEGPERIVGSASGSVDLRKVDSFNTRYNLILDWQQVDLCLTLDPMTQFDISVVDNKTGSEVLTMSGTDCNGSIANKFVAALH